MTVFIACIAVNLLVMGLCLYTYSLLRNPFSMIGAALSFIATCACVFLLIAEMNGWMQP